jgi:hypothetical protein
LRAKGGVNAGERGEIGGENHGKAVQMRLLFAYALLIAGFAQGLWAKGGDSAGIYREMLIFAPIAQHVHGSTVVELPNGGLLAAWFQGSGERWADDVAIMGARLAKGGIPGQRLL